MLLDLLLCLLNDFHLEILSKNDNKDFKAKFTPTFITILHIIIIHRYWKLKLVEYILLTG